MENIKPIKKHPIYHASLATQMSHQIFVLVTLMSCLFTMSATANTELDDFKQAIRAKYDMKEQAFANNDPVPILNNFYLENVLSIGPDGTTHSGREEIRPVYEEVISSTVRIESYDSFVNGNAGWDWANFHVIPPAEANTEPFTFKMLFLWERIDGEWWSHGEMYVPGKFAGKRQR